MHQLREALDSALHKIGLTKPLLARARRRAKSFRLRAEANAASQAAAQVKADDARAAGHPARAARQDRIAARCAHRHERSEIKAVYWRGKIKVHLGRLHHLQADQGELEAEIEQWRREHGVVVDANKVTGGNPGQRWRAALSTSAANCSVGKRRNFYSMSGDWDIDHELVGGPLYGNRSDCSSTVTGWAKACGLPDPNGEGFSAGYTGTLVGEHNGWRQVSREHMERSGAPAYVVYGVGVGHHVEGFLGHGITVGHGSAPVDRGVVDLFGDGDYRCFVYDPQ